jgi:hypothetical protein
MFDDLRSKMTTEEFDYQALMDGLREYDRPRDKITELLRQGAIIRIKKGIYVGSSDFLYSETGISSCKVFINAL